MLEHVSQEKKVFEFYKLTNKLKYVIRSGWKHWNVEKDRIESVAEHIYGVQMLALAMHSEYQYKEVDICKACMMLAIHELGEIVIGDLTYLEIPKEEKGKIEREGVIAILGDLCIKEEILSLFDEFEACVTPLAKFAYYCDKLECDLQCKIYDEEGVVDLNNQSNNIAMKDKAVLELLGKEGSWSNMWLQFGLDKYNYDDNFKAVSLYVKNNK